MKTTGARVSIAASDRLSYHVALPSKDRAMVVLNDADGIACLGPLELEFTGSPLKAIANLQMALTLANVELLQQLELMAMEVEKKNAGQAQSITDELNQPELYERDKSGNH